MCVWIWASQVVLVVTNPPASTETQVQFLGWEDPLEEGMATHSNNLAWRIPWTEEPGRLQFTVTQSWTWLPQLSMHAMYVSMLLSILPTLSFPATQYLPSPQVHKSVPYGCISIASISLNRKTKDYFQTTTYMTVKI